MNRYFPNDKLNPYVIGVLDSETSLMRMFNQSVHLGNASIISETIETYYDLNEMLEISPPREAIESLPGPRECRLCHKGTITMAKSLPSGLIGRTAAQVFSRSMGQCTQLNNAERKNGTTASLSLAQETEGQQILRALIRS